VYVSGGANNGTNAGTFNVNSNNDATNVNRNIGSQLAVGVMPENTSCYQSFRTLAKELVNGFIK